MLVGAAVVGWFLEPHLYTFFDTMGTEAIKKALPKGAEFRQVFDDAPQAFMLQLKLAFMIGLVIAFPFLVLQIWGFIKPGLRTVESKPVERLAPASVLLFAIGATFCWFVLPAAFTWFASFLAAFPGTDLYQKPGAMVFFALKMMAAFGIAFQLPLLVYLLGRMGLLSADTLIRYWRQGVVLIFFASAVITPGGDPFSMLMMGLPLILLFIISVYAVKLTVKPERYYEPELNDLD